MCNVESFTIDFMIKGYLVYKDVWSIFKCCTIAVKKEVEKGLLLGPHRQNPLYSKLLHLVDH